MSAEDMSRSLGYARDDEGTQAAKLRTISRFTWV